MMTVMIKKKKNLIPSIDSPAAAVCEFPNFFSSVFPPERFHETIGVADAVLRLLVFSHFTVIALLWKSK